jgi:hypothetical protein
MKLSLRIATMNLCREEFEQVHLFPKRVGGDFFPLARLDVRVGQVVARAKRLQ